MSPSWVRWVQVTVPTADAAEAIEGHRGQIAEWRREGRLVGSWAIRNGGGFVDVFHARDLLDATVRAEASPLIGEGLCAWTLRPLDSPDPETNRDR